MPDPSILPSAARLPSLMSVCPRDEQCCNRLCSLSVRVILSLGEIHPASSLPTEERVETTPNSTFNLFSLLSHFLSLLGGKILISIHTILKKNFSCVSSSTIYLWLSGLVVVLRVENMFRNIFQRLVPVHVGDLGLQRHLATRTISYGYSCSLFVVCGIHTVDTWLIETIHLGKSIY